MIKLNILNLATSVDGGAGAFSLYFNELLNNNGYNSWLFIKQAESLNSTIISVEKPQTNKLFKLLDRLIKRLNYTKRTKLFKHKYFFFKTNESKEYVSAKEIISKLTFKPDVIIVHWVSGFVNTKTICDLANATNAKIYWYMIDNSPITGGCHYPWECLGFHTDCSNCPAIIRSSKMYIPKKNLAFKKEFIPFNSELIAASEHDWLRARQSLLFKNKKIHKVLSSVDDKKYSLIDKYIPRSFFEIDQTKKVIFYAAAQINNIRKGSIYFIEAMSILQNKLFNEEKQLDDWLILIAGKDIDKFKADIDIPIKSLGFLDEEKLVKAYQAADIFVSTSIEDSGPLMINQSIMCGTPVVSFEMGVALDLVITGETGYRAKLKDSDDLAKGIKSILELNIENYNIMSENCRKLGLDLLHPGVQLEKLNSIFHNI